MSYVIYVLGILTAVMWLSLAFPTASERQNALDRTTTTGKHATHWSGGTWRQ